MSKKAAKPETAEGAEAPAPKKRSKLKLAIFAMAPLVLAGGGYAGWAMFLSGGHEAEAAAATDGTHTAAVDPEKKAAETLELRAQNSFTHSMALAVMIRKDCGKVYVPALLQASEQEARESGRLVNLSWMAAARRTDGLSAKSCGFLLSEIDIANAKAATMLQYGKAAADKAKGGGH